MVKNLPVNAGNMRDVGSIPGSGRSLAGGHGNPLQYSCLENPMDSGAWQAHSMMLQRVRHNWSNLACTLTHTHTHICAEFRSPFPQWSRLLWESCNIIWSMWYSWKFCIRGNIWRIFLYSLTLSTSYFQLAYTEWMMRWQPHCKQAASSMTKGFPGGSSGKESTCQSKICGLNLGVRKIPWPPLQYSSLENPMDRGAWWATVHRVTKRHNWMTVCMQHDQGLQQMSQQNIQISEA